MSIKKQFQEFNRAIRLTDSKKEELKRNRSSLRKKIKECCEQNGWGSPKFYSQGSFVTDTIINPIKETQSDGSTKEKYDIDDGVYFIGEEQKDVTTYHNHIKKAVDGHAKECKDKNACVRVIYANGHHADLPIYWLQQQGNIPQLAHKANGFEDSDPKEFKDWLEGKISQTKEKRQLRRIIRYVKAWADYRTHENKSLQMPSGIVWTVLCAENLTENSSDEVALKETVSQILNNLESCYACLYPTTPVGKDLLQKYDKNTVLEELKSFVDTAKKAVDCDKLIDAVKLWRKIFGERFPDVKDDSSLSKLTAAGIGTTSVTSVVARQHGNPK